MDFHTQCVLQRKTDNGNLTQMSWIPAQFAQEGRVVRLKENGAWTDGWVVIKTYSTRPSDEVADYERDFKNMRKMTDI